MNLQELLTKPEGKTLEFKRELSSLKPILKTLVAFANKAGGTMVVGRENDGTVVGVANVPLDEERLANAVADGIRPGMTPEIDISSHKEVESPGMLPFGMTLDDLKAGVSRIRNRVIARVLRELGLFEEWGTGYRRVTEACRAGGYPVPEWEEFGSALRVLFRPHPEAAAAGDERVNVPVNDRQRWFLDQLSQRRAVKAKEVAAHFGVTEKTARRDIADLKAGNFIEFLGAPKKGFYRIKGKT